MHRHLAAIFDKKPQLLSYVTSLTSARLHVAGARNWSSLRRPNCSPTSAQKYSARIPIHNHNTPFYRRHNSTSKPSQTSFADPTRPDLFYHYTSPPTPLSARMPAYALSFLPTPPASAGSRTIVGWLPAAAEGAGDAGLNDFRENPEFRTLMHEAIKSGLEEGTDDIQMNGAIQTHAGWMHIHDSRNIPALGRIGDPDDILASVRVEDGKILAETYSPMPSYRLCTADGVLQLTEGLARKLREMLEGRDREERAELL